MWGIQERVQKPAIIKKIPTIILDEQKEIDVPLVIPSKKEPLKEKTEEEIRQEKLFNFVDNIEESIKQHDIKESKEEIKHSIRNPLNSIVQLKKPSSESRGKLGEGLKSMMQQMKMSGESLQL